LGWTYAAGGRWEEVEQILDRLDELDLNDEMSRGKDDLDAWLEEATTRIVACASCGIEWRVSRNPDPVPPIRLYAMPPDDMPAGSCPSCGKSYCVGCRKDALDEAGRFTCPECGKTLRLNDEGIKEFVYMWAEENIAEEKKQPETPAPEEQASAEPESSAQESAESPHPESAPAPENRQAPLS
jgi:transcription elongation factor Elf1